MDKEAIRKIATDLVVKGNPYCNRPYSIPFYIGKKLMFMCVFRDKFCTQAELDSDYFATCVKDIEKGYKERKSGYYDKWYRYSRADEGAAYDAGVRLASEESGCSEEFHIIEFAK